MLKYFLSHNGDTEEFEPFGNISVIEDGDDTLIFLKKSVSGKLIFPKSVYPWLFDVDRDEELNILPFTLNIERDEESMFSMEFSTSMCEFNMHSCTATLSINANDKYTPIFSGYKEKHNLFVLSNTTVTVTILGMAYTFERCRDFMNCIEYLARKCIAGVTIESDFFTDATNYITKKPNTLTNLRLIQKSEVMNYLSTQPSEPATKMDCSLYDVFEWLRMLFNVYWDYDKDENKIILEHHDWFRARRENVDITGDRMNLGKNIYKYDLDRMPRREVFTCDDGMTGEGFDKAFIDYLGAMPSVDEKNSILEYKINISTDIEYLVSDQGRSEASRDGFLLLAANDDDELEQKTNWAYNFPKYNGALAIANLVMFYHRHNRPMMQGRINKEHGMDSFVSQKHVYLQEGVSLPVCDDFNNKQYLTDLSNMRFFGTYGVPLRISNRVMDNVIQVTLGYSQPSKGNAGMDFPDANYTLYLLSETYFATLQAACWAVQAEDYGYLFEVDEDPDTGELTYTSTGDPVCPNPDETFYFVGQPNGVSVPKMVYRLFGNVIQEIYTVGTNC